MQQQNRPIQKGKGKRIFLEMRDSLAPSSSESAMQLHQPSQSAVAVSSTPNNVISGSSNHSYKGERSPNPQLKQKEIGNSNEDSMLQLDSDSNDQMPYAKAALHELRQMSARGSSRKQPSSGGSLLPGQNQVM